MESCGQVNPKATEKTQQVHKYNMSSHCGTSYGKIAHKVPTQDLQPGWRGGQGKGGFPGEVALRSRSQKGKGGNGGFRQRRKHKHRCRGLKKPQGIWGYMKFKYFQ